MRAVILQPGYLPWLGFFEQLFKSDVFVIYDDVQYDKGGWRNRNRIKGPGGAQWLSVPVRVKFSEAPLVKDVLIDNTLDWRKKHLETLRQNYSKAPYYDDYIGIFEGAFEQEWKYLIDLDLHFIHELLHCLQMAEKRLLSSTSLGCPGRGTERLVKLCKKIGADTFYEGAAGRNYMNEKLFEDEGIVLEYQDYEHPEYKQLHGKFVPYLSVVDLLFNCGRKSLRILTHKQEKED